MHEPFDPEQTPIRKRHQLLLGAVAPRPIALTATLDPSGGRNLAPFSFFGAFGSNPSVVALSPALRGMDATSKDTLRNVLHSGELTVSIVQHAMAEQMNIASAEYPPGVDEFEKAGLTPLPSVRVAPPGVAESPMILECKLLHHVELGQKASSGNLLVVQVVLFRVKREVLDEAGDIDPAKMDQVARLGRDWYTRASAGLFRLPQPRSRPMGFDALPDFVRNSPVLTGQDLAKLASLPARPPPEASAAEAARSDDALHSELKRRLDAGQVLEAWALIDAMERQRAASR
jgi:flavin reductase (DIM6/NTAB) family NADH-FMN oxidoreductase RutF